MAKFGAIGCVAILVLAAIVGVVVAGTYNNLNTLDQGVRAQWAQVENVYQRRADLVPNLVETVKGAANFEKDTYPRWPRRVPRSARFPATPSRTFSTIPRRSSATSRRNRASPRPCRGSWWWPRPTPTSRRTPTFRELQSQLEGSENRIAVERKRFNEAAQAFNTKRTSFPTTLIAGFFPRFAEKPYFKAAEGADKAPQVKF